MALAVFGRAHRSRHRVPGFQVGTPNLRLPHEDVAGHRGVLHRAQQAVPGVHYLQHSGGYQLIAPGGGLAHALEQRVPAQIGQRAVVAQSNLRRQLDQIRLRHRRQVCYVHLVRCFGAVFVTQQVIVDVIGAATVHS